MGFSWMDFGTNGSQQSIYKYIYLYIVYTNVSPY